MPAKSDKQRRFMKMCEHSPEKAKGKCPSMKVAKEFSHMDKGSKGSGKVKAGASK